VLEQYRILSREHAESRASAEAQAQLTACRERCDELEAHASELAALVASQRTAGIRREALEAENADLRARLDAEFGARSEEREGADTDRARLVERCESLERDLEEERSLRAADRDWHTECELGLSNELTEAKAEIREAEAECAEVCVYFS
jgi:multidrug resistance efflux pump